MPANSFQSSCACADVRPCRTPPAPSLLWSLAKLEACLPAATAAALCEELAAQAGDLAHREFARSAWAVARLVAWQQRAGSRGGSSRSGTPGGGEAARGGRAGGSRSDSSAGEPLMPEGAAEQLCAQAAVRAGCFAADEAVLLVCAAPRLLAARGGPPAEPTHLSVDSSGGAAPPEWLVTELAGLRARVGELAGEQLVALAVALGRLCGSGGPLAGGAGLGAGWGGALEAATARHLAGMGFQVRRRARGLDELAHMGGGRRDGAGCREGAVGCLSPSQHAGFGSQGCNPTITPDPSLAAPQDVINLLWCLAMLGHAPAMRWQRAALAALRTGAAAAAGERMPLSAERAALLLASAGLVGPVAGALEAQRRSELAGRGSAGRGSDAGASTASISELELWYDLPM